MIKRHSYVFLVVLVLAMLSLVVACADPHVHTYAEERSFDDTHHWYAATCEHSDEVKDKAVHTWDEGEETTPAGYGAVGEMTYKCTECDGTKTQRMKNLCAKSG